MCDSRFIQFSMKLPVCIMLLSNNLRAKNEHTLAEQINEYMSSVFDLLDYANNPDFSSYNKAIDYCIKTDKTLENIYNNRYITDDHYNILHTELNRLKITINNILKNELI